MTDSKNSDPLEEPKKKLSLQEAINKQLKNKQNQASGGRTYSNAPAKTKKMKSQQTKKANNQTKRTGV